MSESIAVPAAGAAEATPTGPVVEAHELTRRYGEGDTAVDALRGVSLEVTRGKLTAVMGPSGSGKSTLMHILAALDIPTGGYVVLAGTRLGDLSDTEITKLRRKHIGFVFQFFNLIPSVTALENIELPMVMAGMPEAACRERARRLLGLVDLEAKGHKRPEELSGGEQQRVGVALALANDPALILADEPTGNLDSVNAAAIATLLASLAIEHGKTVIMVSHDAKMVEVFPTVYTMRDGRFVTNETHAGIGA